MAPAIEHLKSLGVTTVELMPVHTFLDDRHLVERGMRQLLGYNTIGFMAPDSRYSASGDISEFKTMVKTLHKAGIEVILDVVYNHTAEGNQLGRHCPSVVSTMPPTIAWRVMIHAITWTTPAVATPWTCNNHVCCN